MATQSAFGVTRSFSGRRWKLRDPDNDAARALMQAGDLSQVLANILAARGVTPDGLGDVLHPTLKRLMPDPLVLKDMEKAVARVREAVARNEKIAVFGDYDVDGSCSAALMSCFLSEIGRRPRIYIPDRMTEGYGPNARAMLQLKEEGASLVVTVDCGAGAVAALSAARDAGLDVIVLDHHAAETPPPAFAHVNPNQREDQSGLGHVCAAGVTFLFLVALNRALRENGWYAANNIAEPDLRAHVDLVGLATVCDVVPLIGINRAFVRAGLARLGTLERPGIAALATIANTNAPFTPYHLGFVFGPRINAGGRVGRCSLGVELLTAASDTDALPFAGMLDKHNRERQAIEAVILEEAIAVAETQHNQPFLLASGDDWHAGVVGIVAGRLKERFSKPAFVVGFENGAGRGSARSIPGVDLGAMVRAARESEILEAGGGHAMAAGFSLQPSKLDAFREFLLMQFAKASDTIGAAFDLEIDAAISPSGATQALINDIARAGPFGAGNREPLIAVPDSRVVFADVVGQKHVRLRLSGGDGARLDAIAFRAAGSPLGEGLLGARGKTIHSIGHLRTDEWNGRSRIQLYIEDAATSGN